ncbi:hypothetical protein HHI36_003309 [Cryptolaemus montrouzieri]|uniref:Reverse transcriptase n=1 Tax=Cryptolaemus montrouzieri TaxID=559131 RepID=A0ABD2PD20_9CUCU
MEVEEAVKFMNNGKSSGRGNLNIELVKAAPDALIEWIVVLFKCLKGQKLPEEWGNAIITPIYIKKETNLIALIIEVVIAGDTDDASYMLRTLKGYFEEFGLVLNTRKMEYMTVCSNDKSDLEIGSGETIKQSDSFKYLGVTLAANGKSANDVSNKKAQGKRVIRQLDLLWNEKN